MKLILNESCELSQPNDLPRIYGTSVAPLAWVPWVLEPTKFEIQTWILFVFPKFIVLVEVVK